MDDTLRISRTALARIVAEAAASQDEVCGLLLGDPAEALACRNVHPQPVRHFEIDPAALLAAHRTARAGGPDVIGCYHSHPSGDATPSPTDAASAPPDGSVWLIAANGAARAWRAVAQGAVHGRFDPVEIAVV
jgi:proteasome lid subunit RPN8/RPN11